MGPPKSVTVILAPYHVGIKDHRVGRGPAAILDAGLIARIERALPSGIPVKVAEIQAVQETPTEVEGDIGRSFGVLRNVSDAVRRARNEGSWPLVLSGNCMNVVGVNAGLNDAEEDNASGADGSGEGDHGQGRQVIWFDAHADLEGPETTESGYLDGMGGRMLLGEGFGRLLGGIAGYRKIEGKQLIGVGFRDYSSSEKDKIAREGVRVVWGRKGLDKGEYRAALEEVLKETSEERRDAVLHVDVDSLDPRVGRANEFAVSGGLGERDLVECVDVVMERRTVRAMHVASLNPEFDGWERCVEVVAKAVERVVARELGS